MDDKTLAKEFSELAGEYKEIRTAWRHFEIGIAYLDKVDKNKRVYRLEEIVNVRKGDSPDEATRKTNVDKIRPIFLEAAKEFEKAYELIGKLYPKLKEKESFCITYSAFAMNTGNTYLALSSHPDFATDPNNTGYFEKGKQLLEKSKEFHSSYYNQHQQEDLEKLLAKFL